MVFSALKKNSAARRPFSFALTPFSPFSETEIDSYYWCKNFGKSAVVAQKGDTFCKNTVYHVRLLQNNFFCARF